MLRSCVLRLQQMRTTISVRLPQDLAEWLEHTAGKTGQSQGKIIREQLERARSEECTKPLIATANTSGVIAERFRIDFYNDTFFLVPTHARSATNNDMTPVTPVLSVPTDVPGVQQTAFGV